ncbi:D-glycerate dehydrogenase [Novosphingobium sp. TH158]|uniref:2-hydroxyacid dehydrogenase n=1 Tax=Novosphingobium sp. TH158 TaxID=2067455 RepID=UPI000C79B846|nr:D-glycerate dehydrogenase [Novosphingobium sp. TH158]PLK25744.1 D-glycerate dehydrogenase [Novosphingobium sp. TH158]
MSALRLLVTRTMPPPVEQRLRTMPLEVEFRPGPVPREELAEALGRFDILLPTITDRIDSELIAGAARTRLIANFGAGVEHVDLDAARSAGIAVTNTPDALTDTTAELAITLMLMAARRAGEGERRLRAGQWKGWGPTAIMGQGLSGKLLGLVGYGRIARATARLARAFGMRIACFSRSPVSADDIETFASLTELAEVADVLSLHVPGGTATRHLVDAGLLARMKPTAILINTARGSVVDEGALADALAAGRIAAAGLDVYEQEPKVHPGLLTCENAVLLPHLGSATLETRTAMGMQALDNIAAWLAGAELPNRVA